MFFVYPRFHKFDQHLPNYQSCQWYIPFCSSDSNWKPCSEETEYNSRLYILCNCSFLPKKRWEIWYSTKYSILQNCYCKVVTQAFQIILNSKKVYWKGYLCVKSCARGDIPSTLLKLIFMWYWVYVKKVFSLCDVIETEVMFLLLSWLCYRSTLVTLRSSLFTIKTGMQT